MAITPDNKVVCVGMSAQTNNDFAIARFFLGPVVNDVEAAGLSLGVYPNPTTGRIRIKGITGIDGSSWTLVDPMGRSMDVDFNTRNGVVEADLSDLPDGAYLLMGDAPEGRMTERVVVRH